MGSQSSLLSTSSPVGRVRVKRKATTKWTGRVTWRRTLLGYVSTWVSLAGSCTTGRTPAWISWLTTWQRSVSSAPVRKSQQLEEPDIRKSGIIGISSAQLNLHDKFLAFIHDQCHSPPVYFMLPSWVQGHTQIKHLSSEPNIAQYSKITFWNWPNLYSRSVHQYKGLIKFWSFKLVLTHLQAFLIIAVF